MQTFWAYVQDDAGALTWAAWIDAAHHDDAMQRAQDICGLMASTIEVWCASDRRTGPAGTVDPI